MTEKTVRTALPSEEEEVMEMCRQLHAENGLFRMSERRVRDGLRLAFQRQGGILGVIGDPGRLEAMIYLILDQPWHDDNWHLEERFAFCRPEYRRSNNAKLLIEFAKRCAMELNMELVIGILSNTRTEQKVKLYERQFGKPAGAFFVFNSKWDRPVAAVG